MLDFASQKKMLEPILRHSTNHICADCDTRSPTWASLDFGVFLCSNCSGAHRALGPTITRVKSANLDLWQEEWLNCMVLGNEQINAYWEADPSHQARKPKMGASPEQIRRYVVEKYVKKRYVRDPAEQDPLAAYKKRVGEKPQPQQPHAEEIKSAETRQQRVEQAKQPAISHATSEQKRQVSLLEFDVELHPPAPQPNNQPQVVEVQLTTHTEYGTSFTSETSKEEFVDFNTLLQGHKQMQVPASQLHHSLSTQAVLQHNPFQIQHQQHQQQQQTQNYPPFTHQNYLMHPYPHLGHHSPPNHPTTSTLNQNPFQPQWN